TPNDPSRDWFSPPPGQPDRPATPPPAAPPQQPQPQQQQQPGEPLPRREGKPTRPRRPRRSQRSQPQQPGPPPGYAPQQDGYVPQEEMFARRGRPPVRPDQQVWPPARPEPVTSATQPIPAIPSAGPLPQNPPPAPPAVPAPVANPQPPRRPRTVLVGVGAVAAFVLALGAPTVDRYLFYKSGQPGDTVHVVAKDQAMTFEHVTWKVGVETLQAPATGQHSTPDKQWVKVTVYRAAADEEGKLLTGRPEVTLQDRAGRSWETVSIDDDVPTEKDQIPIGKEFVYTVGGVVPKNVYDQVEVHLKPDIVYKNNTPTADLMKVSTQETEKYRRNDVLVFRR
ncbi:MAG: hypothetical protein HOY71_30465, partial [Nonomuraea sp.]|nr:hypothetical protein [Nonomuraea sp.]